MTDWKSPSEAATGPSSARSLTLVLAAPSRALALAVLVLLIVARVADPRIVSSLRSHGFDLEQQLKPRTYRLLPAPVLIVAIDEQSLDRYGQWPWPRSLMAQLVDRIAAGHPDVLGVDIIFAEPDRFSPSALAALPALPEHIARELSSLPSSEAALASAFSKVPTVLGMGFSYEAPSARRGPLRTTMVRESGNNPRAFLQSYRGLVRSLPELTAAARGSGVLVGEPDRDGILRRLPLFVVGQGNIVPSMMLEMLRVAFGRLIGIVTGHLGVQGATLGSLFLPTDWRARAYPYFTPSIVNRYVSAADLLDKSFDPGKLHQAIVLLGVTALGLVDQKQTPLGLMPGVEVEAQLLESMLSDNLLRRPAFIDDAEIALLVAACLVTIFFLPYESPLLAGVIFVALIALLIGAEYASFRIGLVLFDGVYPALGVGVTFAVMLGANLRAAELARRRLSVALEHEREAKARLEGELNAARQIQMGLLPQHFIGLPEHPGVDIYAIVEPARMVGGDLYDFIMLDARHLAFTIADVSGKGVPAALFMAMSKEVLRDAIIRHQDALDRAFAEANTRISAASNDMAGVGANMMFVTVFAGILDLASGKLLYVNAGHDAPLLLGSDTQIGQLAGRGGPPLGSVDDFDYPVEQRQLAPRQTLLLFTDGVTEAENREHSFYAQERLEKLLGEAPKASARGVVEFVREDVHRFAAGAEQADDITLLAVRWLGAPQADA
jgi:adenylate cyclase